ncbi:hypothetical protein T484DRAFT_1745231 [Baffinella frigidus]|nr:hypothetical protein T484DRAFT_1745231 [Cryptophyta sp. CCMP2293]
MDSFTWTRFTSTTSVAKFHNPVEKKARVPNSKLRKVKIAKAPKAPKAHAPRPCVLDPLSEECVLKRVNRIGTCVCTGYLVCEACNIKYKPMGGFLETLDLCNRNFSLDIRPYTNDAGIACYEDSWHLDGIGYLPCTLCHAFVDTSKKVPYDSVNASGSMILRECEVCPSCLVSEPGFEKRCNTCNCDNSSALLD